MPGSIAGVNVHNLQCNRDERGDLHEIMRDSWGLQAVEQWNIIRTEAGVLRGMAVHLHNVDYYANVVGRALLGLSDLRPESPTFGRGCLIQLSETELIAVSIPTGVAHGIYFQTECLTLAGLSTLFDATDKLCCRWDDPALNIPWPTITPRLLARDLNAASVVDLIEHVRRHQAKH